MILGFLGLSAVIKDLEHKLHLAELRIEDLQRDIDIINKEIKK